MSYTNVLQTTKPADDNASDPPSKGAEEIRKIKLILEERLSGMFHGLTPTETDETKKGVKVLPFRAQAAAPDTDATALQVYPLTVSGKPELFMKNADGTETQITEGGVLKLTNAVVDALLSVTTKTGTATSTAASKLADTAQTFVAGDVGSLVHNTTDDTYAVITARDSAAIVSLDRDIFTSGEAYEVIPMPTEDEEFATKAYVDRGERNTSQVRATKSADQSIGGVATTKITFDTETFDTLGEFTGSKFTATIKGAYSIGVGIYYYGAQGTLNGLNHAVTNNDTIEIWKNGALLYSVPALRLAAAEYRYFEYNQVANLEVGDYIEIYITRASSWAVTAVKSGTGGSVLNIQRIP